MKIIITGSGGFVGKNLFKYLDQRKHDVRTLSLRKSWQLDLTADVLIHLAGKAHDTSDKSDESEYFQINYDLTRKIFEEFRTSEIRDFIYFSSVKATADTIQGVLDENHIPTPKTPYGKSKHKAEKYLLNQELPEGKRLFIIRPCMIHGPGNKGNLNMLYRIVDKGIPWPLASFDNERSFLCVDNMNYLVLKMLEHKDLRSGIYNFADDEFLSTNELVLLIAQVLGRRQKMWKIPVQLIHFLVKIGDVLPLPLNAERLKKLTENYRVSNQKIKSALGIDRLPLTAQQGMKLTVKSFKN